MLRLLVQAASLAAMLGAPSACHDRTGQDQAARYTPTVEATSTLPASRAGEGAELEEACDAGRAAPFIGKPDTPQNRTELERAVGHDRIRWIHPGEAVSQDYRPDRLNVIVGDSHRIVALRCG